MKDGSQKIRAQQFGEFGLFPVEARKFIRVTSLVIANTCAPFTRRAIVPNGSGKSPKPVSAGGRNSYTDKPRKSCWPKAGSTRPRSCFARFLPSARFGRFCWLHFSKHRIGSAPRGNYGPTVV